MRTTLDIPDNLIEELMNILGYKSKTDTVVYSLKEAIRKHKLEEIKGHYGKIKIDIDLKKSRRR